MGHVDYVRSVSIGPDTKIIASGNDDNTVRLLDASSGSKVEEPLEGHNDFVRSVAFSTDKKIIASANDDNTV